MPLSPYEQTVFHLLIICNVPLFRINFLQVEFHSLHKSFQVNIEAVGGLLLWKTPVFRGKVEVMYETLLCMKDGNDFKCKNASPSIDKCHA